MRVGVVVPTLNEEAALRQHLPAALAIADELVVSDGGSTDGSLDLARELGARVVCGPAGRGQQLNRGAGALATDILLFLHADTALPADPLPPVRRAIAAGCVGGGFLVRFASERPIMRLGSRLVNLRTRLTRAPLGDQGQFVRRDVFERLAGFRDWPILEDLDFALRLRRAGRIGIVEAPVSTSARRYLRQGVARTVALNWLIALLFFCGVAPETLARLYRHVR